MSRKLFRDYVLLIIIGILFYQIVQQPRHIYTFIKFLSKLFTPFWIGCFFAIILNPIVKGLEKGVKLPRSLSILLTYLGLFMIIAMSTVIIVPSLITGINDLFTEMSSYLNSPDQWIAKYFNGPYVEEVKTFILENFNNVTKNVMTFINRFSSSIFTSIINLTAHLFNVIFGITISIYLIIDQEKVMESFKKGTLVYLPQYSNKIYYFIHYTYHLFQDYVIGRLLDSLIIGFLAYIGFVLLKAPYVWLFAFIIFITNIIPYFGPIIGAIIPILLTVIVDPVQGIWVALFILVLQQLDGNLIGPKIMGDRVGLSPLWVISSVLIGGTLGGFIGFFLAVPVAAVIKEFYDQMTEFRLAQIKKERLNQC